MSQTPMQFSKKDYLALMYAYTLSKLSIDPSEITLDEIIEYLFYINTSELNMEDGAQTRDFIRLAYDFASKQAKYKYLFDDPVESKIRDIDSILSTNRFSVAMVIKDPKFKSFIEGIVPKIEESYLSMEQELKRKGLYR